MKLIGTSNKRERVQQERRQSSLPLFRQSGCFKPCRSNKIDGVLKVSLLWWTLLFINRHLCEVLSFQSSYRRFPVFSQQLIFSKRQAIYCCSTSFGSSSTSVFNAPVPDAGFLPHDFNVTVDAYCFRQKDLSVQSFNMDLRSAARSDPRRAQIILDTMEGLYQKDPTNSSLVEPNAVSYMTVIEGWYLHKIDRTPQNGSGGDKGNSVPDGMTKVNTRDMDEIAAKAEQCNFTRAAASSAQSLLDRMIQSDRLKPGASTFLLVCQKWAECSSTTDTTGVYMEMAQSVLDVYGKTLIQEGANETQQQMSSDSGNILSKLYTTVFEGWCRLIGKVPQAMVIAEALLQDMENLAHDERRRQEEGPVENNWGGSKNSSWFHRRRGFIGPNTLTYSNIIVGISQSKRHNMARKADAMIDRMKRNGVEPDVVVYTSVLNCWAKATSRKEREMASRRALDILQVMEDSYTKEKNYLLKPSLITYTTAIKAIGYSLDFRAPDLAESVLKRMYNLTENGLIHVPPNVATYNAVINALSTSGSNRNKKGAYARKAEALLVEMIRRSRMDGETSLEPSVVSWGSVLRAYSLSGMPDCGEQAQRIVDMLEEWYESGNTNVRPNVVCYTTVMSAWARGKAPGKVALQKANEILSKLEKLYEETLDESFRPNKVTYITAMDVYCRKCPDVAGSMSQNLVDHMLELYAKDIGYDRPTRIVFNTLISAWSRSQEPNAAENAEKIFGWLESGDESIKPDEVTLCAVLNAWANNAVDGGAMRAQQIMDHTEKLTAEQRGFDRTIVPWNILIKAWGRSKTEDSVQRAETILVNLENQYRSGESNVKPDITTYSSVINCCAYYTGPTDGKTAAFEVAWRTFHKIKRSDDLVVNNIVYGTLFKAIGKLTSRGQKQEDMIKDLFLDCCQAGQVCNFVLGQVRTSSPRELFRSLVPKSIEDRDARNLEKILKKMPKKWSRNVAY